MLLQTDDTIAALASPPGGCVRGIIRISGAAAKSSLSDLFRPRDSDCWDRSRIPARHVGTLHVDDLAPPLAAGVWLWPGRRSYTGEPIAEIHTIGSPPLLEAILAALHARGVRPARAGEFTLRAFLAGRIDLTQAEAVLGVIDADGQQELHAALRQLAGGVSQLLGPVRSDLLDLLADLEAGLDFVDEDIEFVTAEAVQSRLREARVALDGLLRQASGRMRTKTRRRVVLAGLPNAGKSTLFNALAERDAAIVSPVEGTTRDWLSAELEWNGVPIELIDTAGWDAEALGPSRDAQKLRNEQWDAADLIVWCTAADLAAAEVSRDASLRQSLHTAGRPLLEALTRCDLQPDAPTTSALLRISAPHHRGLEELRSAASTVLSETDAPGRQLLGATASRCRDSLTSAIDSLRQAEEDAASGVGDELIAIPLRESLEYLGRILGAVYTDDILDRLFSRFCIGK